MNLFRFELNKYLNLKSFLLLLALIVGITSFFFIRNILFQTAVSVEEQKDIESHLQSTYQVINEHREGVKVNPDNEQEQKLLEISLSIKDEIFVMRNAHNQGDWHEKLTSENQFYQLIENYKNNGGFFPISDEELVQSQALNQQLLSKNIPPQHHTYSLATPNFMKELSDWYLIIGIPIIMLLFVGGIITNEYERNTIRLLFTQPLNRISLLLTKGGVGLIFYLVVVLCSLFTSFLISSYFGESGTFDYPVLIHLGEEISFINVKEYLWISFTLFSVVVVMCLSYYLLLSLLLRHTLGTIILFAMTLIIGNFIHDWLSNLELGWINPFRNLLIQESVVNQSIDRWYVGIPIALVLSVGFIGISLAMLSTRKFLKSR